jgi:ferric-dicitrate binding protein FerR (iron transport regulator)
VDGDLTERELAELASALDGDPALADVLAQAYRVDACLTAHFGVQAHAPGAASALGRLAMGRSPEAAGPQRPVLRRRVVWCAAAAAVALVAILWGLTRSRYPQPRASGSFEVVGGGSVRRGAMLRTEAEPASVSLGGYCRVEIDPGSVVRVGGGPRDERIRLERGRIVCEVVPGSGAFAVETEVCTVAVRGTRFTVEILEPKGGDVMLPKQALVKVFAGLVLVTTAGGSFEARAGEEKRVPEAPAAAPVLDALPEAVREIALAEAKGTAIKDITGTYEVVLTDGQRIRIRVDGTGAARLLRANAPLDELPDAVKTVMERETKGTPQIAVNKETRLIGYGDQQHAVTTYRAQWAGRTATNYMEVDPDGKVTRVAVSGLTLEEVPAAVKATILKEGLGAAVLIDLVAPGVYHADSPRGLLRVDSTGKVIGPLQDQPKPDETKAPPKGTEF